MTTFNKGAIVVGLATISILLALHYRPKPVLNSEPDPDSREAQAGVTVVVEKPRIVGHQATNSSASPPPLVFDWRKVETTDYRSYIANLRAIGCPEETIRDIIRADVNKLLESRSRAKRPSTNRFEYWKPGSAVARVVNEEFLKEQRELAQQKKALLTELLGPEAAAKPDLSGGMAAFEQMMDFLPSEKWNQTMEVELLYAGHLASGLQDLLNGDFNTIKKSLAEKEALLGQILTPEEKFDYDARFSYSAISLQNRLGDFTPTEQEYRELVRIQKQYDETFGLLSQNTPGKDVSQERAAAQTERDAQARALLGDERYREYRNEQNWARSNLRGVAQEYGIPKQTAFSVFDITDAAKEQADRIRANAVFSQYQKQEALDAVRRETETAVGQLIGPSALQAYMKRSQTINSLNRLTR